MERPIDCKAGHKHHLTEDYLKHLQKSLMDICMRENLNQIDLLSPSLSKVSEQEYYAKRRGQINLDLTNLELLGDGFTPVKTTFETEKEKIRNAITDVAKRSVSFYGLPKPIKAGIRHSGKRPSRAIQLSSGRQKKIYLGQNAGNQF